MSSSIRSLSLLISFSLSLEICPSSSSASASGSAAKKMIRNDYNAICFILLYHIFFFCHSNVVFFCLRFKKALVALRSNVPFLQESAGEVSLMLAIILKRFCTCCCRLLLLLFSVSENILWKFSYDSKDFKEAVLCVL